MNHRIIIVKAAWDTDARVWYVESSDVPGLRLEAESVEGLAELLPAAILDLLEASGEVSGDARDVPIELIAHASTRLRLTM
jgi:hypothetical protein